MTECGCSVGRWGGGRAVPGACGPSLGVAGRESRPVIDRIYRALCSESHREKVEVVSLRCIANASKYLAVRIVQRCRVTCDHLRSRCHYCYLLGSSAVPRSRRNTSRLSKTCECANRLRRCFHFAR